jgi:hypothetical protein
MSEPKAPKGLKTHLNMLCHRCENCTNAIVPPTANIVAIMYSITQFNVVGRVHTASIMATAHAHAATVSTTTISINLLITISFRSIIKK